MHKGLEEVWLPWAGSGGCCWGWGCCCLPPALVAGTCIPTHCVTLRLVAATPLISLWISWRHGKWLEHRGMSRNNFPA